jgi:hypothetical protein
MKKIFKRIRIKTNLPFKIKLIMFKIINNKQTLKSPQKMNKISNKSKLSILNKNKLKNNKSFNQIKKEKNLYK